MKRLVAFSIVAMVLCATAQAPAQLIFGKKTKTNPNQRVPELILIVKTDPDERKRAQAAEELRDYDTATFTEIVPVLAEVLITDKKPSVRAEALNSLVKIRPVSAFAGNAIEKAAAADESIRVRWQAKAALPKYHLAGYVSGKTEATAAKKKPTDEPPLGPNTAKKGTEPAVFPRPLPVGPDSPKPLPPGVATPTTPVEGPSLFPTK